ncbi:MAG: hypothetical protein IJ416_00730 [Ruminiclostridium sp.]|nr:hypothetical protein [Ruminiclostridium sp.]
MLKKIFGKLQPPRADIRLSEDGGIVIEGKYYFYRNNKRAKGETPVKIDSEDILRIGKRTIASTNLMIVGVIIVIIALFCFSKTAELSSAMAVGGAATITEGVNEQGLGAVVGAGESVGSAVGIESLDDDYSQSLMDSGAEKISEGEEQIGDSIALFIFMVLITTVVILSGGFVLVCYFFTIRKYIEVFTEYGSFCVPEAYVEKGTLDALIRKRNMRR